MAANFIYLEGIKAGETDVTLTFMARQVADNQAKTGVESVMVAYWRGPGTTISTLVTTGAGSAASPHLDGLLTELSSLYMKGLYRLDLPDAVCAEGMPFAQVAVMPNAASSVYVVPYFIPLGMTDVSTLTTLATEIKTLAVGVRSLSTEVKTLVVAGNLVGTQSKSLTTETKSLIVAGNLVGTQVKSLATEVKTLIVAGNAVGTEAKSLVVGVGVDVSSVTVQVSSMSVQVSSVGAQISSLSVQVSTAAARVSSVAAQVSSLAVDVSSVSVGVTKISTFAEEILRAAVNKRTYNNVTGILSIYNDAGDVPRWCFRKLDKDGDAVVVGDNVPTQTLPGTV